MKAPTVFFSWQSDSPACRNTNLIRRALVSACELQIENAFRVDEAAKGVSGTPDIPDTLLRKIRECAVAVFDVTVVGETFRRFEVEKSATKCLPNPNVFFELGYGASAIGWERILTVFNLDGGHDPSELPFDLRHRRRPVVYDTADGTSKAQRKLTEGLREGIGYCLGAPHEQATVMRSRLDHDLLVALRRVGLEDCFHHGEDGEPSVETVRRMLDIGMIWCDQAPKEGKYAYHFTYVGKLLQRQLKA